MKIYNVLCYTELPTNAYYDLEKYFLDDIQEILELDGVFIDKHIFANKNLYFIIETGIFCQSLVEYYISDKPLQYKFINKSLCVFCENKLVKEIIL